MKNAFRFYVAALVALGCLVIYSCSKNSNSPSPAQSASSSSRPVQTTQLAPPPNTPSPAVVTLTCAQTNPNTGACTLLLYEANYAGVALSWPANTNFMYQLNTVGTLVGAPLPSVSPSLGYSAAASTDGTLPPFGSFVLTQWSYGGNCLTAFNSAVDQYYGALSTYFNALSANPNTSTSPPNFDTYLFSANGKCTLGAPTASSVGFKLVVYQLNANGSPVFACVPLNWVYKGLQVQ